MVAPLLGLWRHRLTPYSLSRESEVLTPVVAARGAPMTAVRCCQMVLSCAFLQADGLASTPVASTQSAPGWIRVCERGVEDRDLSPVDPQRTDNSRAVPSRGRILAGADPWMP